MPDQLAAYSLARLRMTAAALTVSVPIGILYTVLRLAPVALALALVTEVVAAGVWLGVARGGIPAHDARRWQTALFLLINASLAAAWRIYGQPQFLLITAIAILGLAVVQIDLRQLVIGYVVVGLTYAVLGTIGGGALHPADVVVFAATYALGGLLFASVRSFVLTTNALRGLAEQRSVALAEALEAARRELADRVRAEAEREQLRDQFVASQKMEALGTLAGGVAHDVNNVLAGITTLAELVRDRAAPEQLEDLDAILASCKRGAALTRNLLTFSRRGQYRTRVMPLAEAIEHVLEILRRTMPKQVRLEARLEDGLFVDGDPAQLAQAVLNLCLNAIDAMPRGGTLTLTTRSRALTVEDAGALPPGRYAAIAVEDSGTGMDAATRARLFEPFFTTKPLGKGTGLGLAMVYGTVTAHGGRIDVTTAEGAGTRFELLLPAVDAAGVARPARATSAGGAAPATVLVIDDEPLIRTMTSRVLAQAGHHVHLADNGASGLAAFAAHPEIDVVLLDMAMPEMDGATCFRRLRELAPGARIVLASGYADDGDVRACLAEGALGFLEKPFARARLLEAVELAARGQPIPVLEAS